MLTIQQAEALSYRELQAALQTLRKSGVSTPKLNSTYTVLRTFLVELITEGTVSVESNLDHSTDDVTEVFTESDTTESDQELPEGYCETCMGKGWVTVHESLGALVPDDQPTCPDCDGTGIDPDYQADDNGDGDDNGDAVYSVELADTQASQSLEYDQSMPDNGLRAMELMSLLLVGVFIFCDTTLKVCRSLANVVYRLAKWLWKATRPLRYRLGDELHLLLLRHRLA